MNAEVLRRRELERKRVERHVNRISLTLVMAAAVICFFVSIAVIIQEG